MLMKIIKIVATRCHVLKLKCPKFDFGWGSAPDPVGEPTVLSPTGFKDFRAFPQLQICHYTGHWALLPPSRLCTRRLGY